MGELNAVPMRINGVEGAAGQVKLSGGPGVLETWGAAAGGYTEGARVYHNTNQNIPNATWTYLAFNSEDFDTDTMHDTVVNNSRLTCQTAGKYLIAGYFSYTPNATGARFICVRLNGATTKSSFCIPAVGSGHETSTTTVLTLDLSVSDYVELGAYQDSGGNLNVVAQTYSPYFMAQRVG